MADTAPPVPSFGEALRVWLRIGLLGFGGPAGQIALMHRELVEKRRWVDEPRFLHALSYCTLLPGPEAQQLATYVGWLLHGTRGALAAGTLFVLPGFVVLLTISALYAEYQSLPLMSSALFGLKAAVLALVLEALQRIAKRALHTSTHRVIAVSGFLALAVLGLPFPWLVLFAGLAGWSLARWAPNALEGAKANKAATEAAEESVLDGMARRGELAHTQPSVPRAVRTLVVCLLLWFGPLALLGQVFGNDSVFVTVGAFMSKAATVTFGGAYAVLAYVGQEAVQTYGWLRPGEMVDGLGLAETTPGPLILVLQFVGFLAAYRQPTGLHPLVAGTLGAVITVWTTFVPCFLWILVGAPWVEALRNHKGLKAILSSITAAVVGVVAHLTLWFALHTWFSTVGVASWGPLRVPWPEFSTLDLRAVALSAAAAVALLRFHLGLGWVLGGSVVVGLLLHALA